MKEMFTLYQSIKGLRVREDETIKRSLPGERVDFSITGNTSNNSTRGAESKCKIHAINFPC